MARLAVTHPSPQLRLPPAAPEIAPQYLTFFQPPKGMNALSSLTRMPKEFASLVANLSLSRGKLVSRLPVGAFGQAAADPIMHTMDLVLSDDRRIPVRFTTTSFQYFDGTNWITVAGDAISGGETDFFTTTVWNDKLLFDNGESGLHEFNPVTNTLRIIAAAPKSQHLATFAGRVIASSVKDPTRESYRIKWSVKNNSDDWSGLGSGFEDLLSAPGGQIDGVMGVFPITDDSALIVRTNSIWLMTTTGAFDTPFRFTLLFSDLGCESRGTIKTVPGGVVFLGKDDVYVVTRSGYTQIGEPVLNTLIHQSEIGRTEAQAEVIPHLQKYLVGVKEGTAVTAINRVWEYSFPDKGWVQHRYPFGVRTFAHTRFLSGAGLSIDSLVGTIDGLSGTIDGLGFTGDIVDGMYFSMAGAGRFSVRDDPTRTSDVVDAGLAGAATIDGLAGSIDGLVGTIDDLSNIKFVVDTNSPIEIRTGVVHSDDPLKKIELIEAQLEYEAGEAQTLIFEYSNDGGATWSNYSQIAVAVTTKPEVLRVRRTVSTRSLMVRARSATLGRLTLIALHLFATRGAMVNA